MGTDQVEGRDADLVRPGIRSTSQRPRLSIVCDGKPACSIHQVTGPKQEILEGSRFMKAILTLASIFLFLPSTAVSQTNVASEPGGRNKPGFVYDDARKKFLLFGGFGGRGEGVHGDTWEWDGVKWTRVETPGPSRRGAAGMTYDSKRQRVVLFGGFGTDQQLADTWEWDGKTWRQVATSGPSARSVPQLVFDTRRQKVVLFGGFDQAKRQPLGDTWEWDGAKWTQVSSTGPAPRFHHYLVYDSKRGKAVLFGGNQATTPPPDQGLFGDTWEWDGKRWQKVAEGGPPKRDHHGMSYDRARGKVVLFGGWNKTFLGDTWEWDGAKWVEIRSTGPSARGGVPSLAYDSDRKKVVLFGGWDENGPVSDVWEWEGKQWVRVK